MNNNPWITDRKPTEYDADPCGNVEVVFTNRNPLSVIEKLGAQIYNERHYRKKVTAGLISRPWRHTPEWIDKTSVDGIKQKLNEKFDEIEKDYLKKSNVSKELSFQKHSDFGKRQDQDFEYAKKFGSFLYPIIERTVVQAKSRSLDARYTLEIKDDLLSGSFLTSSGSSSVQWVYNGPKFKKPNWLGRQIAKLCGMEW
jgi:hypothetical protein